MTRYFAIYVPNENSLQLSIQSRTWGWKNGVDRHGNELLGYAYNNELGLTNDEGNPLTRMDMIKSIDLGDIVVFYSGGTTTRTKDSKSWVSEPPRRRVIAEVTSRYYNDKTSIWNDDVYPHRIKFRVIEDSDSLDSDDEPTVLPDSMLVAALRSANVISTPVWNQAFSNDSWLDSTEDTKTYHIENTSFLIRSGDRVRLAKARVEQGQLRIKLIGDKKFAECAICGRMLPVQLLHVAHIKKRAFSTKEERNNPNNLMLACKLGCDDLFEQNRIFVDSSGKIKLNEAKFSGSQEETDLKQFILTLVDKTCTVYSSENAEFFEWRKQH